MAQRLKDSVRQSILAAASQAFARDGYTGTRLQDVAAAAGISTGNLYRYYPDKEALFDAIVPRALAARLLKLLRARVRELGQAENWGEMTAEGSATAHALLAFFVQTRIASLILMSGGARGSPLEHIRPAVVRELTRLASNYLRLHHAAPDLVVPQAVLVQIFVNTADMIAAILRSYESPAEIAAAFAAFWRYQLAGLQALMAGMNRSSAWPMPPIN